ncbi:nucleotide pyrophosphohydrolase [Rhodococcus sp. WY5]|uniref:nucleotide pyrophosphohydrolase n=1 Tax=Rhodococcus sp. WY5 TaxID=2708349 RepID=UPI001BDF3D96|nr:nucleotide pyrophosphohydrolase [Rhodococcus sp. WY5]
MSTLDDLISAQRNFAIARDWEQFHSPKNLAMALGGEVGELCLEIDPLFETDTDTIELMGVAHTRLRNEVGDVALYLLRLCDVLRIDPAEAFGPALSHTETSELCPIAGIPAALAQAVCRLNGSTGLVLEVFQWEESTHTALPSRMTELELNRRLRSVATSLISLADFVGVDVFDTARAKLAANEQRYPVDLSRGSSRKYTEFKTGSGEDIKPRTVPLDVYSTVSSSWFRASTRSRSFQVGWRGPRNYLLHASHTRVLPVRCALSTVSVLFRQLGGFLSAARASPDADAVPSRVPQM